MSEISLPRPPEGGQRKFGRALAVVGSALLFAPLISFFVTAVKMVQMVGSMASARTNGRDESLLIPDVQGAIVVLAVCIGLWLIGMILVTVAMAAFKYFTPWLWYTLLAAAIVALLAGYAGLIVGVMGGIVLVWKRPVFFVSSTT